MQTKYLFIIIGLLVIAFGLYICKYPPVCGDNSARTLITNKSSSEIKPSMLRAGLIREMVNNYRQTQLKAIENAGPDAVKDDAHSILFDLDTLKKFLNDIENATKRYEANAQLGIRMYYAAYPQDSKWGPEGYARKHTLIMIPVIKNNKGIYADFNPLDKSTYQGFPKKPATAMRLFAEPPLDTSDIPGLNHGQLIPPASNQGEGF